MKESIARWLMMNGDCIFVPGTDLNLFCGHMGLGIVDVTVEEAWSLWKDVFFGAAHAAIPKVRWRRSRMIADALVFLCKNNYSSEQEGIRIKELF